MTIWIFSMLSRYWSDHLWVWVRYAFAAGSQNRPVMMLCVQQQAHLPQVWPSHRGRQLLTFLMSEAVQGWVKLLFCQFLCLLSLVWHKSLDKIIWYWAKEDIDSSAKMCPARQKMKSSIPIPKKFMLGPDSKILRVHVENSCQSQKRLRDLSVSRNVASRIPSSLFIGEIQLDCSSMIIQAFCYHASR